MVYFLLLRFRLGAAVREVAFRATRLLEFRSGTTGLRGGCKEPGEFIEVAQSGLNQSRPGNHARNGFLEERYIRATCAVGINETSITEKFIGCRLFTRRGADEAAVGPRKVRSSLCKGSIVILEKLVGHLQAALRRPATCSLIALTKSIDGFLRPGEGGVRGDVDKRQ